MEEIDALIGDVEKEISILQKRMLMVHPAKEIAYDRSRGVELTRRLLSRGWKPTVLARKLNCSYMSVYAWSKAWYYPTIPNCYQLEKIVEDEKNAKPPTQLN